MFAVAASVHLRGEPVSSFFFFSFLSGGDGIGLHSIVTSFFSFVFFLGTILLYVHISGVAY